MEKSEKNDELRDLLTHQAGATDLHKTRQTSKPVQINPPAVPTTGAVGSKEQ